MPPNSNPCHVCGKPAVCWASNGNGSVPTPYCAEHNPYLFEAVEPGRLEAAEGAARELDALWKAEKRKTRELREHLNKLTTAAVRVIAALDAEMKRPSSPERGGRIAKIVGVLELANDSALHFGLDVGLKGLERHKARILERKD